MHARRRSSQRSPRSSALLLLRSGLSFVSWSGRPPLPTHPPTITTTTRTTTTPTHPLLPRRFHLAAKPKKGTAVLFHSIKPSGELERRSLHTACPVIKGEKWSMPKVRVGRRGWVGGWVGQLCEGPLQLLFGCPGGRSAAAEDRWVGAAPAAAVVASPCESMRHVAQGTRGKRVGVPGGCGYYTRLD